MAYLFTFLFLATAYITPGVLFGPLGPYHVEVIIAALAILASIPAIGRSGVLRLPQTYAALAVAVAVVLSIAVLGWLGGVVKVCYDFLPVLAAFFLVAINFRKKWHFQLVIAALIACSAFYIARGFADLQNHVLPSPYLYTNEAVPRLRGLGVVNDPNDLAQVFVSLIPLAFFLRTKSRIANVVVVGVPIAVLIFGMYLTHSRGSSIALMVVVLIAFRRKIGTVPAAILAGGLLVAVLAAGWGAGRDVSLEGGADRLDAWSTGLTFIKTHPVLGVGYQQFKELNYITAHNSVVVCAAEIGVPGFFCWVLFIFSTYRISLKLDHTGEGVTDEAAEGAASARDRAGTGPPRAPVLLRKPVAVERISPQSYWARRNEGTAVAVAAPADVAGLRLHEPSLAMTGATLRGPETPPISAGELRRLALLLTVALAGFLTAGWFLSRALSIWLFMYCGMVCAIQRMARDNGVPAVPDRTAWLLRWSAILGVGLILLVYAVLRIRNVIGH